MMRILFELGFGLKKREPVGGLDVGTMRSCDRAYSVKGSVIG